MTFSFISYGPGNCAEIDFPLFSLIKNNWDDYGTKCSYTLYYYPKHGSNIEIGLVKILSSQEDQEDIPDSFKSLDECFVSLGQSNNYYEMLLKHLGVDGSRDLLEALRDISWNPQLSLAHETNSPFRNSLLRNNSAQKARRFGRSIILGTPIEERFDFKYSADLPGVAEPVEVFIDFDETDEIPGRVVGIIGRNAVGKTQFLARLARDLVQVTKTSKNSIDERDERFAGSRPIFNRVITISYSAFDKFIRPKTPQQASYIYCGIRSEKGTLTKRHLLESYKANHDRIKQLNREHDWLECLHGVLGETSDELHAKSCEEFNSVQLEAEAVSLLSSGQSILAHFVTAMFAWIEPNSLILFDEPETHLHPNAVASLFGFMNYTLKEFDSFAIVATHSPVVIQEIPGKRVLLFQRNGNTTTANNIAVETFGESISSLTQHVFETIEIPNYYKQTLKRLSRKHSFEEVNKMFNGKLGINAQAYLLSVEKNEKS